MIVYHGSYIKIPEPNLGFGRSNLDFGKGFYVTTLQDQAERWATRRVRTRNILHSEKPTDGIVSVYEFHITSELKILSFDGYSEAWLDFVVANRSGDRSVTAAPQDYDAVFGSIANDDVAREVDDYTELLRKGRVNEDVKKALLFQLQYSKANDQYCIASLRALENLEYTRAYIVGRDGGR